MTEFKAGQLAKVGPFTVKIINIDASTALVQVVTSTGNGRFSVIDSDRLGQV